MGGDVKLQVSCWQEWYESGGRIKMACVWKWFAYVLVVKAINQGKVLVLDLYLQSTKYHI